MCHVPQTGGRHQKTAIQQVGVKAFSSPLHIRAPNRLQSHLKAAKQKWTQNQPRRVQQPKISIESLEASKEKRKGRTSEFDEVHFGRSYEVEEDDGEEIRVRGKVRN